MDAMDLSSKTEPEPSPATSVSQWLAALTARLLSITTLVLLFVWIYVHQGGLNWNTSSKLFFNLHPFFMTLGIAFFLTNGVLSWRDIPLSHLATKIIHVTFNVLAVGCIAIGLYITIAAHAHQPQIVTLHSWIALASVGLLVLQAIGGALFFLLPAFPFSVRARVLPQHAWLGVVSYAALMFVVLTGIIQWMAYQNVKDRGGYRSGGGVLGNVLGLFIFVTALTALWAIMPRRNVAVDIEERDGVSISDPSRSRLKAPSYATPTSRSTGLYGAGTNPFGTEAVPPRRGAVTTEREERF